MHIVDWDKIKSVNDKSKEIPIYISKLISHDKSLMLRNRTDLEHEIIKAGLLYEAAYYAIDLIIKELEIKNDQNYEKWFALVLLEEICIRSDSEEILKLTNPFGIEDVINLKIACRKKIKSYLDIIKSVKVHDKYSKEIKNDLIEIIECWDENYSNEKYFNS